MTDARLHHVGLLVKNIPEAVEVYTRRYGYEVRSPVIHDPAQTAYVQFLALPGDSSYLEFVAPDRPDSKLSNALGKGGGLHHLCYATGAIDQACAELRGQGMFLIQPPVPAVAFPGRRIAWLMGRDRTLIELVEKAADGTL
jgi:methylmalonyl-CoA/ethylmalonyl-CoA epimerase